MPVKKVNQDLNLQNELLSWSKIKQGILDELHEIYTHPSQGIISIGKKVGLHLNAPRRKINILLVGNHSSGKSTFINWYIGQKVQKTSVAIETQGFTLVTYGKNRETLIGEATLYLYPYLKPLASMSGVIPYLSTELVPVSVRPYNSITLIDTPGLADGALHYPYDIEKAIQWFGENSDLIFVFFDPIGQALCKRTLSLVERLNKCYSNKMHYFLSKADEAGDESDRQKVMMQIVQELCKHPGLNQCGFDMLTIYIPNHSDLKIREQMCINQIDSVCEKIDKTIGLTIQTTFHRMDNDIKQIVELLNDKLKINSTNTTFNRISLMKMIILFLFCIEFPFAALAPQFRTMETWWKSPLRNRADLLIAVTDSIAVYLHCIYRLQVFIFSEENIILGSLVISIMIFFIGTRFIQFKEVLSEDQTTELNHVSLLIAQYQKRRDILFSDYINSMCNANLN